MDLHTKQKIFEQLKITDKFIIKVLLTIDTDYLFIKESLKNLLTLLISSKDLIIIFLESLDIV